MGVVGLAENKANSAPLELELWLSLATGSSRTELGKMKSNEVKWGEQGKQDQQQTRSNGAKQSHGGHMGQKGSHGFKQT